MLSITQRHTDAVDTDGVSDSGFVTVRGVRERDDGEVCAFVEVTLDCSRAVMVKRVGDSARVRFLSLEY